CLAAKNNLSASESSSEYSNCRSPFLTPSLMLGRLIPLRPALLAIRIQIHVFRDAEVKFDEVVQVLHFLCQICWKNFAVDRIRVRGKPVDNVLRVASEID